jgi:hypothetical protein
MGRVVPEKRYPPRDRDLKGEGFKVNRTRIYGLMAE